MRPPRASRFSLSLSHSLFLLQILFFIGFLYTHIAHIMYTFLQFGLHSRRHFLFFLARILRARAFFLHFLLLYLPFFKFNRLFVGWAPRLKMCRVNPGFMCLRVKNTWFVKNSYILNILPYHLVLKHGTYIIIIIIINLLILFYYYLFFMESQKTFRLD